GSVYVNFFVVPEGDNMKGKIIPEKNKIKNLINQERDAIALWIKDGMRLPDIYRLLKEKHPELTFSQNGFVFSLRRDASDLHENALFNRSTVAVFMQKQHSEMTLMVNSGCLLKNVHEALFSHISYSVFLRYIVKLYPDLHYQAKLNRKGAVCGELHHEENASVYQNDEVC
ncbi:TPA: hypothetical protein ACHKHB_005067, partial [Escherichia coli]